MGTSRAVAAVAASVMALVLAGCSSSDPAPAPSATTATPAEATRTFSPPAGVTITPGGTTLAIGAPATVVHQVADSARSAITVTVSRVKKASIKDFRFFSLDDAAKKSTPYYVRATVANDGPAGLGGAAMPMFVVDSAGTTIAANDIVGTFDPCPVSTLPESFLPGASASLCLVYLVPQGRKLTSVRLQTGTPADAVAWTP